MVAIAGPLFAELFKGYLRLPLTSKANKDWRSSAWSTLADRWTSGKISHHSNSRKTVAKEILDDHVKLVGQVETGTSRRATEITSSSSLQKSTDFSSQFSSTLRVLRCNTQCGWANTSSFRRSRNQTVGTSCTRSSATECGPDGLLTQILLLLRKFNSFSQILNSDTKALY